MGKFIFTVQGEGRGHLTQAISMTQIAREAGHEVVGYAVGSFQGRKIPAFFTEFIGDIPLIQYESPSINYGNGNSVQLGKTAMQAITRFKTYCKSASSLEKFIYKLQPDGIVNFYESITGLYFLKTRSKIPCMSIGHQYLLLNRHFKSISEKRFDQFLLNINTKFTAIGTKKFLGLSFREMPDDVEKNIYVVPPLLRQEVKKIVPVAGKSWLMYVTHYKLADQIISWAEKNKEITLDCFWDHPEKKEVFSPSKNLTFHPIDAEKYLAKMSICAGLISTAGFESVAEAMYLKKPVMMVPVPNHIEQMINAYDGEISGAGIAAKSFDLEIFKDYLSHNRMANNDYEVWAQKTSLKISEHLDGLIQTKAKKSTFEFSDFFLKVISKLLQISSLKSA
jgi:uncharacterized protein (TIGR00661 family)